MNCWTAWLWRRASWMLPDCALAGAAVPAVSAPAAHRVTIQRERQWVNGADISQVSFGAVAPSARGLSLIECSDRAFCWGTLRRVRAYYHALEDIAYSVLRIGERPQGASGMGVLVKLFGRSREFLPLLHGR